MLDHALDDWRHTAVETRERAADGLFVVGVVTTGIYCRPGCPARTPRPENRRFFATPAEAEAAGFRACLRCHPKEAPADGIERACRFAETCEERPSLGTLARVAGLSPFHFHRAFKARMGMTPRAWVAASRAERLRAGLAAGSQVTAAIHEAGFANASRAYEAAPAALGMAPSRYRNRGAGETIRAAIAATSLGFLLVAATDIGVVRIAFGAPPILAAELKADFAAAEIRFEDPGLSDLVGKVVQLIEAPTPTHDLPLDIRGTAFQRRVWEALRAIPAGATATYEEIAERIGAPRAARAVAGACAANRLPVAIPCHRVVPKGGGHGGYAYGPERKSALLDRERNLM
jgi:AraC family transcriptional regulator of adaptative response/methylated-DNA-[protein]-cysteine methyltransferase